MTSSSVDLFVFSRPFLKTEYMALNPLKPYSHKCQKVTEEMKSQLTCIETVVPHEKYSDENDSMFLTFPPHSVGLHLLTEIHLLVPCGRAARGGASEEVVGEGADDDGVLRPVHDPTRLGPAGSTFLYWMSFPKCSAGGALYLWPRRGPVRSCFNGYGAHRNAWGLAPTHAVIGFEKRPDSVFLRIFL